MTHWRTREDGLHRDADGTLSGWGVVQVVGSECRGWVIVGVGTVTVRECEFHVRDGMWEPQPSQTFALERLQRVKWQKRKPGNDPEPTRPSPMEDRRA